MADNDVSEATAEARTRDLQVLDDVLRAARTPCPTEATAWNAGSNPQSYDEFAIKWRDPLVRLVLGRFAPSMPDDDVRRMIEGNGYDNWWSGHSLDGYADRRKSVVDWIEKLHRRFAAATPKDAESVRAPKQDAEARALGELAKDPNRTDEQIAAAARCARTSLYRMPKFREARAVHRRAGADRRNGRHDGRDAIDDRRPEDGLP